MVNIDKLNETISGLELKAKEVETLVEKQKNIHILAKEVEVLKEKINLESKSIIENSMTINKLINDSKDRVIDIDIAIKNRFDVISREIEDHNNVLSKILDKQEGNIKEEINNQNKNIREVIKVLSNVENNVSKLNSEIIKKLNDITTENYRAIGEFQKALETKTGLLKSEILFSMKEQEARQEEVLKSKVNIINKGIEEIKSIQANIERKYELKSSALDKAMKNHQIMMIIIILLVIGSILVGFIK